MSTILEKEAAAAAQILKGFIIPPRPDVLTSFQEERGKENPNLHHVSEIICSGPGLSAGVIKTINSPYFGLGRKIASIQEAITILGLIQSGQHRQQPCAGQRHRQQGSHGSFLGYRAERSPDIARSHEIRRRSLEK